MRPASGRAVRARPRPESAAAAHALGLAGRRALSARYTGAASPAKEAPRRRRARSLSLSRAPKATRASLRLVNRSPPDRSPEVAALSGTERWSPGHLAPGGALPEPLSSRRRRPRRCTSRHPSREAEPTRREETLAGPLVGGEPLRQGGGPVGRVPDGSPGRSPNSRGRPRSPSVSSTLC